MTNTATTVKVDLGGRTVEIPKDGLFDRYRMDVPLDKVAADPRVPSVDFFRTLPKTQSNRRSARQGRRTSTTRCPPRV